MLLGVGGVTRPSMLDRARLHVNLSHAQADKIKEKLTHASQFLRCILATTEQLSRSERSRRISAKIFEKYLDGRPLRGTLPALPSG
jgi:hypothetical protein